MHPFYCFIVAIIALAIPARATDFHFSPSGNDTFGNGSIGSPYQSISRLNQLNLDPGDRVLFEGGETFSGNIQLNASDAGTAANPVEITSYGTGRATIQASSWDAIYAYNVAGIEIRNINIASTGRESSTGAGIFFYTDYSDGRKLEHLRIEDVDVSGFLKGGITVSSWHANNPGYRDVRIERVYAYDNGWHGIASWSYFNGSAKYWGHEDIYIGHCIANDNPGDPDLDSHSGNGIVLSGVDGAVIEHCWADNNGALNAHVNGGPCAIWCYEANDVVIQYNIASNNKNGNTNADGGGFDIDGGSTNCVMQYNYSYNNEGAGFLFAQYSGATAFTDNVARYNISENDGRRNGYGAVTLWSSGSAGGIQRTDLVGNTLYVTPASSGSPRAIQFQSGGSTIKNTRVSNNIFVTTGARELIRATSIPNTTSFLGNLYWASGSDFKIRWGGTTYTSLDAWRSASGQETYASAPTGIEADPLLKNPGAGIALTDPTQLASLTGYELNVGSPAVNAGIDLAAFAITSGGRDCFGNAAPVGAFDIGAHERPSIHALDYAEWQYTYDWPATADTSPTGDADADGASNLLEYALTSNPLNAQQTNAPQSTLTQDGGDYWLALQYTRSQTATDLTETINASTTLSSWAPLAIDGVTTILTILDPDPIGDGSAETVEVKTKLPAATPSLFLQLAVNQQ